MPLGAQERTGHIEGRVLDATSRQPLASVNVYLSDTFWGDASDSTGAFHIGPLLPGRYQLKVERIGYQVYSEALIVPAGEILTMEILLYLEALEGEASTVEGVRRIDQPWRSATPSSYLLKPRQLQILPGAFEDIMRALQSLPGVIAVSDYTNQLLVRGGGPDQNLILLDGVELYSPYKANGMSSTLNPDMLGEVALFTGGYPAIYGDRLSSVLSASIKEGGIGGFGGSIGLNLVNSNLTLEGKTPFINGGWIIGVRRTHFDLFAESFAEGIGIINDVAFPDFEDVQAKVVLRPLAGHVLQFTAMLNLDKTEFIYQDEIGQQDSSSTSPDSSTVSPEGEDTANNELFAASWSFAAGSRLNGTFYGNWYRNRGDSGFSGRLEAQDPVSGGMFAPPPVFGGGDVMEFSYTRGYQFVRQTVGTRWRVTLEKHLLEAGAGMEQLSNRLNFSMEVNDFGRAILEALSDAPNWLGAVADTIDQVQIYNRSHIYLHEIWTPSEALTLQPSVRYDYYGIVKQGFISPRLNLSYKLGEIGTMLNASWGRYVQSPGQEKVLDLGRGSGLSPYGSLDGVKVEQATHYVLGISRSSTRGWNLRLEGYAKQFEQLLVQRLAYQDRLHAVYRGGGDGPTDPDAYSVRADSALVTLAQAVNDASGQSLGLELLVERRTLAPDDHLSGWIAYTFAKTTRERTFNGIARSTSFDYDRPHALDVVFNYRFGKNNNWRLGILWRYGTGFPYTPALRAEPLVATVPVPDNPDQLINIIMVDPDSGIPRFVPDYGDDSNINSRRFPDYHRLDIRLSHTRQWNDRSWEVYLDVINVYNRKNVLYYQSVIEIMTYDDDNLPLALRRRPAPVLYRQPVYMFPLIPTFGMSLTF
ncbi:MAG: carboxypeptidase-like regulatory domain-containing protein [Candidatus Marinimicrobia bacterium]|nr:carboxypeptidase-like regulatory domain-containing protein [Candidatus Neomarinimicrobiota bacterium]